MKAATEDLKKNIIEVKQKQVEIETKLDVIATSQFRILREVAEIKQAPTRNEDAFFIPSAEDLVEIGDSEEPESEPVEEPTTSRRSAREHASRKPDRKRRAPRSPTHSEHGRRHDRERSPHPRKVLMDDETLMAMKKLGNMKICPERWTGHREERVLDEQGKPQLCPFCGRKGNHTPDECPAERSVQTRLWLVQKEKLCRKCLQKFCREYRCPKCLEACSYCDSTNHHPALCGLPEEREELMQKIRATACSPPRNKPARAARN
ncbi:hypothetical protein Aduo_017572 [Ancylostoma duodenale]